MARTKPKERARDRILTDDELRAVKAAEASTGPYGQLVRFILLTATRRYEAPRMPATELTGDDWVSPGARYKTKLDHIIPLSRASAICWRLASIPEGYEISRVVLVVRLRKR